MFLFEKGEAERLLPYNDERAKHIQKVLKKKSGDSIFAGQINGLTGKALISERHDGILLNFQAENIPDKLLNITVILGFPRPIQAGRIFKDLTCLGVSSIKLALTDLGEKSYAESNFFKNSEWNFFLREGAIQAGNPNIPEVSRYWSLKAALESLKSESCRVALDNEKPECGFASLDLKDPVVLAFGSERGFSEFERNLLVKNEFILASLGKRILKTETAVLAATSIAMERLGVYN